MVKMHVCNTPNHSGKYWSSDTCHGLNSKHESSSWCTGWLRSIFPTIDDKNKIEWDYPSSKNQFTAKTCTVTISIQSSSMTLLTSLNSIGPEKKRTLLVDIRDTHPHPISSKPLAADVPIPLWGAPLWGVILFVYPFVIKHGHGMSRSGCFMVF